MGSMGRCKTCEAPVSGYYQTCKDCVRERARVRRDEIAAWVAKIKLDRGCESPECQWVGPFEAPILEFDHVRGEKEFTIASNLGRAKRALLAEIAKCDVLCANCHRLRHLRDKKTKWRGTEVEMRDENE